jgi:erythronate-4-phosphate dehydrogenase
MIRIVTDDRIPFLKGILEPFADVVYLPGHQINQAALRHADGLIIRTRTRCDESLLEGTDVRFIASATSGFEHIDTRYCASHHISWFYAAGCNSSSVSQYVASALATLSAMDQIPLKGLTIGIIGAGHIGIKVASLAHNLDMKVLLNDPPRARKEGPSQFVSLRQILHESDVVTLHIPLTMSEKDHTFHLIARDAFHAMNKPVWLLNTSRGEVIDGRDLKNALQSGRLKSVVLDVWEDEPVIDLELLKLVRLATPHIAGYSADGKANATTMCINAVSRFFSMDITTAGLVTLPPPREPVITIDGFIKTPEEILMEAILATYKIEEDDKRLRNSPETFEAQRNDYPVRREFPAYTVNVTNPVQNIGELLAQSGFKLSRKV